MNTVLLRHEDARFERQVIEPWLASISDLSGVIVIRNKRNRTLRRVRAEHRRSGLLGLADVVAFRLYYRLFLADVESKKIDQLIERAGGRYADEETDDVPRITVDDPNNERAKRFLEEHAPEAAVARIKVLLEREIFDVPSAGTYVIHPGICPQYRNAHGCFWALAEDDTENVGYTLLRIDEGIDTGPIYSQGSTEFDSASDGHLYIQYKVVADNLDEIGTALSEAVLGERDSIDVSGRDSDVWGQPRLSAYRRWKREVG